MDWGDLANGGKDGLFLAVVSLGWWLLARDPSEDSMVDEGIEDVTWVINNLVSVLSVAATSGPNMALVHSAPPSTKQRAKRPAPTKLNPPSKRTKPGRA